MHGDNHDQVWWAEMNRRLAAWCHFLAGKKFPPDSADEQQQKALIAILEYQPEKPISYGKEVARKWSRPSPTVRKDYRRLLAKHQPVFPQTDATDPNDFAFVVWEMLFRATPSELTVLPGALAKKNRGIKRTNTEIQYVRRMKDGRIHRRDLLKAGLAGIGALFLRGTIPGPEEPFDPRRMNDIISMFHQFRLNGLLRLIPWLCDPIIENAKAWLERFTPTNDAVADTFMRFFDLRHLVAQDLMMECDFQDASMERIFAFNILSSAKDKEWHVRHLQDQCRAPFHRELYDETLRIRKTLDSSDLPSLFFRTLGEDPNAVTIAFETGSFLASAGLADYAKWFSAAADRADPTMKARVQLQILKREIEFRPDPKLAWDNYEQMERITAAHPNVVNAALHKVQADLCKLFALIIAEREPEARKLYKEIREEVITSCYYQGEHRLDLCFLKAGRKTGDKTKKMCHEILTTLSY